MHAVKTLAQIGLIIFIYYIVYYSYLGITNPIPSLGDSWDYHIPISQTIIDGTFLHPTNFLLPQWYYPGSSEAINSILILLLVPLTLSNILAVMILFFVCIKLGLVFRLNYWLSILFAVTICTLNVIVRWYNAVSIDVWMAVFFLLSIILLERPQKSIKYFLMLGFTLGMLIGSKYTGIYFLFILIIFYFKNIISNINLKNIISFSIPFTFFGLFWYIRNYLFTQNPFYPLPVFSFKGQELFTDNVLNETLKHPWQMFNAFFSEYNVWLVIIAAAVSIYYYKSIIHKINNIPGINRLFVIGILNIIVYFTFPCSERPEIMVSSLRYSFPAFIPLILGAFIVSSYYKKELLLGLVAVGNMIMVLSMTFYPKLTLIYLPLGFLVIYLMKKFEKNFNKEIPISEK